MSLFAKQHDVGPFELPDVNIFAGNELDPTDQPDAALIFGGDGTLHRHLGTLELNKTPVLPVPIGSANDFAATMGIHSVADALAAWRQFCATRANTALVDLGTIQPLLPYEASELLAAEPEDDRDQPWEGESLETLHFVPDGPRRDLPQLGPRIEHSQARRWLDAEHEAQRTRYFAGIAGTGLDAVISHAVREQPRWLRAHGGYVWGLVRSLPRFHPPQVSVSLLIDGHWQTPVREPAVLIAAGNGPRYGSGMRIAHLADMNDGLLDVCFVRQLSKLRLLRLFHVVFSGRHIGMKEVEYWKATRVRIQTDPVMDLYADGEYVCPTPVEFAVKREALQVIVPG
ncbi:MAG TPA: diacylglycerol kinase family protein [Candidatus Angelobacter sp.]|nr:diacylglycerol kinase family protein [Candidatus Angelobacter sp.]